MGFWDDLWDAILGLFGGRGDEPEPKPQGTRVNIRVRKEGGGNIGLGGAIVTLGVRGEKVRRGTNSEGWVHFMNVDPGPRHVWVEKEGYKNFDHHLEIRGTDLTFTVALEKAGSKPAPSPGPSPGPTPPMTSDKVTALRRVAQAYIEEYEDAHVGRIPGQHQPKQEAFIRRAAACLHYGAVTLGIKGDGETMLLGQRGEDVISQDALLYDGGYYDVIIGAGTQGRDLSRLTWHRGGPQGNAKAIRPDRGLVPKASGGARTPPEGAVKGDRHAFRDRRGPFVAVGATYFPAMWLLKHNPARLDENLNWLSRRGVDFIRYFVEVGVDRFGDAWTDRLINPHEKGAKERLIELIERVYRFGMRSQITIFGSTGFSNTPALRAATVNQVADVTNGREEMIFYDEIVNEGWQVFGGPYPREVRVLAALFKNREPNILLALTAPRTAVDTPALYGGSAASVMTIHVERSSGPGIRLEDVKRLSNVPLLKSSGEPRGPGASAGGDVSDPDTLVNDFKKTIAAGVGAYVYHSEAGIWAGSKNAPHKPNLRDEPNADAIVRGIVKARDQMRGDEANR